MPSASVMWTGYHVAPKEPSIMQKRGDRDERLRPPPDLVTTPRDWTSPFGARGRCFRAERFADAFLPLWGRADDAQDRRNVLQGEVAAAQRLREPGRAGPSVELSGFVLRRSCRPVVGVLVDLWQADDAASAGDARGAVAADAWEGARDIAECRVKVLLNRGRLAIDLIMVFR